MFHVDRGEAVRTSSSRIFCSLYGIRRQGHRKWTEIWVDLMFASKVPHDSTGLWVLFVSSNGRKLSVEPLGDGRGLSHDFVSECDWLVRGLADTFSRQLLY
jgi:hypothetical protein